MNEFYEIFSLPISLIILGIGVYFAYLNIRLFYDVHDIKEMIEKKNK